MLGYQDSVQNVSNSPNNNVGSLANGYKLTLMLKMLIANTNFIKLIKSLDSGYFTVLTANKPILLPFIFNHVPKVRILTDKLYSGETIMNLMVHIPWDLVTELIALVLNLT